MNLGTLGLLGLLQTATPSNNPESDSINFLRDSVVIPQIMKEKGRVYVFEIPFILNDASADKIIIIPLPSFCRMNTVNYTGGKIISAAYCRDVGFDMGAFAMTGGLVDDSGNFKGKYMIDWGRDNEIDLCYEVVMFRKAVFQKPLNREECQPHYFTLLEALKEKYERKNTPPPGAIGDLDQS